MNLDELRTVQSKERSKDSLQHLRESFYEDVADYIADLRARRERAAERADNPFDDSEVNRLTDEIQTAEEVVEAIYERRVGKVVKRASLAAAGMPADEEGLTAEEQELFGELVERIETNKQEVLDVLAGESDDEEAGSDDPPAASEPEVETAPTAAEGAAPGGADIDAADVMGGDPEPTAANRDESDPAAERAPEPDADGNRPTAEAAAIADDFDGGPETGSADAESADAIPDGEEPDPRPDTDAQSADDTEESDRDSEGLLDELAERTTVRITDEVGEIFGVDERTYDLEPEDVVTLPAANADPLVERDAAERLE
ncbi:hypothetical protein BRC82_05050 [Halobacteriales archaeon QS_1_67_19]|nr:MAG: hypothetical protein BRC82_05050 [Halobacteriales archaeon QS_1_67_19]